MSPLSSAQRADSPCRHSPLRIGWGTALVCFAIISSSDSATAQTQHISDSYPEPFRAADSDGDFPALTLGDLVSGATSTEDPAAVDPNATDELNAPLPNSIQIAAPIEAADQLELRDFLERPWVELPIRDVLPLDSSEDTPEPIEEKTKPKPTTNISIEIQSDFAWFSQDEDNVAAVGEIPDGAFFRRARFGIFGELYETFEYRIEFDFAEQARPRFLDVWIAMTDLPLIRNLIVGHYFEPFSLERYSPNRFITFNERSLADSFAPVRNMGAMTYGHALEERLTWAFGFFRSNSDDYGEDVSFEDGYASTAHATFLAWFEELNEYQLSLLHLGGSFSYRLPGDDPVRYAARPSVRMSQQGVGGVPNFVDTGDILDARHTLLYGVDTAWVHGPFSIQAELIQAEVNRRQNDNATFRGGYIFGSYFLTGESRSYSPTSILGRFREGIFQRVTPRSNVFDRTTGTGWTGCGAIELATRWAFIDLNDAGIEGGYLEDMTYGVTWYLNPYTKGMFNYVRPTLKDPKNGESMADMFSVRFQFEY